MQQYIYNTYNIHGYLEQYPELKNSYKSIRKGKFNRNIRTGDETDWFWTLEQLELDMEQQFSSVQFSHSVMSNSLQPMDCSMPGFPVHHQLLELAQTQVYQVGDAIQPSHPLLSPLLLPSIFQKHQSLFQ